MKRKGKYFQKTVFCGQVIRIAKYVSGRMGTKDQRRRREKPTAEKVKRWQDKRAVQHCFDLLHCNFHPGDLWMTFTYPPGAKPDSGRVREDIARFRKRLRNLCRKAGKELKYIFSVGRGKRGAVHFHMVLPQMDTAAVERAWQETAGTEACPWPRVNTRHLDGSGYWPKLAEYIVKNGLETFRSGDPIYARRFVASTNLARPKVKVEVIRASFWKEDPVDRKGWQVDRERVWNGSGPSGFPYQSYTLIRRNI